MKFVHKIALTASLIAGSVFYVAGSASALPLSPLDGTGDTQIIQVQRHGSGNNQYSGRYDDEWKHRHYRERSDWHRERWDRDRRHSRDWDRYHDRDRDRDRFSAP